MTRTATSYTDQGRAAHVPTMAGAVDVSTPVEEWRVVAEFPDFQVSNLGRVKNRDGSIKRSTAVGQKRGDRRFVVGFWANGHTATRLVSRVVCTAFHGPAPSRQHHAAHADGDVGNNASSNLRWATAKENAQDKYAHGTHLQGDDCPWSKLTKAAVIEIRNAPKRVGECDRLARKFGVAKATVAKIRTRSNTWLWPDVPFPEGGVRA